MKLTSALTFLLTSINNVNVVESFVIPKAALTTNKLSAFTTTTTAPRRILKVSSKEEDLELTRQIILEHTAHQDDLEETMRVLTEHNDFEYKEEDKEDGAMMPIMVKAALGKQTNRTPTWLFRQAGRHLPEYREYKEKVNRNFWEMLKYPQDVAECTLQPLRRYEHLDAAILFSDILVIPAAMGMDVIMPGGVGIQIPNPIQTPSDLEQYACPSTNEEARELVNDKLGHVLTSVQLIKSKMAEEGYSNKPLIGFSATPFTLLFYMVGGSSKKNPNAGVDFLKTYPDEAKAILKSLTKIVIEYVVAQVEKGAQLLQFFEAMGMMIDEDTFLEYELECLEEIAREVRARVGDNVPLMIFARGASYANKHLIKIPEYNVFTIDGSINRLTIRNELSSSKNIVLQGNFDPKEMIEKDTNNNKETIKRAAIDYLNELGPTNLIANLGEGLGGLESTELVNEFLNVIHDESSKMISSSKE